MAAALGLQIGWNQRPQRAKGQRHRNRQWNHHNSGQKAEVQANQRRAQPANIGLPVAADVEQPRLEGHRHGKSGKNKAGGIIERIAKAIDRAQTACDHQAGGVNRVLANRQNHKAGNNKGQCDIEQRNGDNIRPFWQVDRCAHAATSVTPAISMPKSCGLVCSGRRSPVICPPHITIMRSDKAVISSSSTDTSRMALPASRMAISFL